MDLNNPNSIQTLIQLAKPTFAGQSSAPMSFTLRMTRLLLEQRQLRNLEHLGWRAFQCSFVAVAILVTIRIVEIASQPDEFDPGTRNLIHFKADASILPY